MKLFLSKGFLAHFRGFVVWSVHVSKSGHPRIDRTLSVRRIVMSCFRPDESPKFGIVLRSSNRRSRDRRNHVVPESKPNPASPQPTLKMKPFLSISYWGEPQRAPHLRVDSDFRHSRYICIYKSSVFFFFFFFFKNRASDRLALCPRRSNQNPAQIPYCDFAFLWL